MLLESWAAAAPNSLLFFSGLYVLVIIIFDCTDFLPEASLVCEVGLSLTTTLRVPERTAAFQCSESQPKLGDPKLYVPRDKGRELYKLRFGKTAQGPAEGERVGLGMPTWAACCQLSTLRGHPCTGGSCELDCW